MRQVLAKACVVLLAAGLCSAAAAQHVFVEPNLRYFGLDDLAQEARCVYRYIPANKTWEFANTYWGPTVPHTYDGKCWSARTRLTRKDADEMRQVFKQAASICLGEDVTSDESLQMRRLGYAAAVFVANGKPKFAESGTLLDDFVAGTKMCQDR